MNTAPTVLVCGAGQLGSRYLQGLSGYPKPLKIHVHDVREESLTAADRRWREVRSTDCAHELTFDLSFESLPRLVDVAIVATTADVRPHVVAGICNRSSVRYWVLEKVLAQNEAGLDQISSRIATNSRAWVNTPRRIMPWHRQIKDRLSPRGGITLEIRGGQWGLACNAVHFFDLLAWWTGEAIQRVSTERLDPKWFASKRSGFWEISGTLEAFFSGGSRALLTAGQDGTSAFMTVNQGELQWQVNEAKGIASRSDGLEIPGRMPYQSEMTAVLMESILEGGSCGLPTLEDSVATHRVFLRAIQEHWKRSGHPDATLVPIT